MDFTFCHCFYQLVRGLPIVCTMGLTLLPRVDTLIAIVRGLFIINRWLQYYNIMAPVNTVLIMDIF